jgi:DNA-binding transcriptional regulator YdaS (Cro superfamily)
MDAGIEKAAKAAGTISALAKKLGITRSAICQWPRIPAERVVEIEKVTGVPRAELRPDLYAPPEDVPAKEPAGAAS